MKTTRHRIAFTLLGLAALAPVLTSQAQIIAAPMPDFTITKVTVVGNTEQVTVKNIGTGNAPGCILRAYNWNGAVWQEFQSVNVSPLAVGATSVKAFSKGTARKYVIDVTNAVIESKENNNIAYFPVPAG